MISSMFHQLVSYVPGTEPCSCIFIFIFDVYLLGIPHRYCGAPRISLPLSSLSTCTIVQPLRRLRRLPELRGGFFGGPGGEPFRELFTSFSSGTFRQSLRCAHIKMAALYELRAATFPNPQSQIPIDSKLRRQLKIQSCEEFSSKSKKAAS